MSTARKKKPSEQTPGGASDTDTTASGVPFSSSSDISSVSGETFASTVTVAAPKGKLKPAAVTETLNAIDTYVDNRVGSDWLQPDIDTVLSYTDKLEAQGLDTSKIETFVKQRGF